MCSTVMLRVLTQPKYQNCLLKCHNTMMNNYSLSFNVTKKKVLERTGQVKKKKKLKVNVKKSNVQDPPLEIYMTKQFTSTCSALTGKFSRFMKNLNIILLSWGWTNDYKKSLFWWTIPITSIRIWLFSPKNSAENARITSIIRDERLKHANII